MIGRQKVKFDLSKAIKLPSKVNTCSVEVLHRVVQEKKKEMRYQMMMHMEMREILTARGGWIEIQIYSWLKRILKVINMDKMEKLR